MELLRKCCMMICEDGVYTNPTYNARYGYASIPKSEIDDIINSSLGAPITSQNISLPDLDALTLDYCDQFLSAEQLLATFFTLAAISKHNRKLIKIQINSYGFSYFVSSETRCALQPKRDKLMLYLMILGLDVTQPQFLSRIVKCENGVVSENTLYIAYKVFDLGVSPIGKSKKECRLTCDALLVNSDICNEYNLCRGCRAHKLVISMYHSYFEELTLFHLLHSKILKTEK